MRKMKVYLVLNKKVKNYLVNLNYVFKIINFFKLKTKINKTNMFTLSVYKKKKLYFYLKSQKSIK